MICSSELIWVMVDIVNYMWCNCKIENICIFDILV